MAVSVRKVHRATRARQAIRQTGSQRRGGRAMVARASMSMEDQAKAMDAAQSRWEKQVREGRFKSVSTSDVKDMLKDGWTLLDVRPKGEHKRAYVAGSEHIPLFEEAKGMDPASLLKQMSAFGMGGWWLGTKHVEPNNEFLKTVHDKIPRESKVIVACQKGLRSLAACEQLANTGYEEIAWISGGFDVANKGDLSIEGEKEDIRYAGVGGVSEMVGWTEVQQEEQQGLGGGVTNVLKVVGGIVVLDLLALGYEQIQYMASH